MSFTTMIGLILLANLIALVLIVKAIHAHFTEQWSHDTRRFAALAGMTILFSPYAFDSSPSEGSSPWTWLTVVLIAAILATAALGFRALGRMMRRHPWIHSKTRLTRRVS